MMKGRQSDEIAGRSIVKGGLSNVIGAISIKEEGKSIKKHTILIVEGPKSIDGRAIWHVVGVILNVKPKYQMAKQKSRIVIGIV